MSLRFSITGLDGTGKTTLTGQLGADSGLRAAGVKTLHIPRHYDDLDLPLGRVGRAFDKLGQLADQRRDMPLKAVSLFAILTMTGELERFIADTYAPALLVGERQALVDSLVYAKAYLPLLGKPLDEPAVAAALDVVLNRAEREAVDAWLALVSKRTGRDCSLWALTRTLAEMFAEPTAALVASLQRAYSARFPDELLVLTADQPTFAARLAAKRLAGQEAEPHENPQLLGQLQAVQGQVVQGLAALAPQTRVHFLEVSGLTRDEVYERAKAYVVAASQRRQGAAKVIGAVKEQRVRS